MRAQSVAHCPTRVLPPFARCLDVIRSVERVREHALQRQREIRKTTVRLNRVEMGSTKQTELALPLRRLVPTANTVMNERRFSPLKIH